MLNHPSNQRPEACIIKLNTTVIYGFRSKLVFVPGKPFQPSLVFKDKLSSLLRKTVNYGCNMFYYTGPWGQCYKTFLTIICELLIYARGLVRLGWKNSPGRNTLAY